MTTRLSARPVPAGPPPRTFDPESLNDRVRAEFDCDHERAVLTYRLASNGVKQFKRQCLRCGQATSEVFKHAALSAVEKAAAVEFDDEVRKRWWERRSERYDQLRVQALSRDSREWWDWYNAYLSTPGWYARRLAVLERSRGLCEGCRAQAAVQVHHLSYDHVGDEFLWELAAVCMDCHRRVHPEMESGA